MTATTDTEGTDDTPRAPSLDGLLAVWQRWSMADTWRRVAEHTDAPTPLEALQASAELVRRLTGWRWMAIREARRAGASWADVGEALGISKQGAQQLYSDAIARQERYAPDHHDAAAARAVAGPDEDEVATPAYRPGVIVGVDTPYDDEAV